MAFGRAALRDFADARVSFVGDVQRAGQDSDRRWATQASGRGSASVTEETGCSGSGDGGDYPGPAGGVFAGSAGLPSPKGVSPLMR